MNSTNVGDDGRWTFQTDDVDGPVSLAFYVVADFNCATTVVASEYLPSWYENQPFVDTNPVTAVPPAGATQVDPGSTDIVACLAPGELPIRCAVPTTTLSGLVVSGGPVPISQACIFALGPSGPVGQTVTGDDGRWTIADLPINFPFVIGVIPPFDVGFGPCRSQGPPPVPAAGQLQPEFYADTWVNLADQALLSDPYGWGTARGAQSITNSRSGIDVCLTTDPGTVVPRPSCDGATTTPQPTDTPFPTPTVATEPASNPPTAEADPASGDGTSLANTGGPSALLLALAAGLLALGISLLHRSHARSR